MSNETELERLKAARDAAWEAARAKAREAAQVAAWEAAQVARAAEGEK